MKKLPLVSITITTKNEEENIAACLKSIKNQTYPQNKIEIIVVDNNSRDKTKDIAKQYTKKVFNIGPERSAQRNFGMSKISQGKYVMFLDADMMLSPKLIEAAVKKLEKTDLSALYIPEVILGDSFWSKAHCFERSFYDGTVIDCVRIIRKDVFVKAGGFCLSITGTEDWDLDKKIRDMGKVAVLRKKGVVIYHDEIEFNLKEYLAKKNYYCKTVGRYIKKWQKDDPDIKKQFGFWYRFVQVFTERGKWKKLVSHPILATGVYFLRILVGAIYLYQSYLAGKETIPIVRFSKHGQGGKNVKNLPLVSIIIPTYYSATVIKDCLSSIKKQSYKNIEIIIVDNFSKDKIKAVAKKYGARVFFYGPDQKRRIFGAPYQRNYGFRKARGKYVYYVDADMILSKNLISECVAICEKDKKVAAIIIREMSFGKGFWAKCKWLERETYWGDNNVESPRFFKKAIIDEYGGLDESLGGGGDDLDLALRLRSRSEEIVRTKESFICHNEGKLTLKKLFLKRFLYGQDIVKFSKKHGLKALFKSYSPIRACYLKNWRFLLSHPILLTGMIIMRTVEYAGGFCGLINNFLRGKP